MKVRDIMAPRQAESEFPLRQPPSASPAPLLRHPGNRDFLSRPLGQESNPDAWDAWEPFMVWLLEHYPDRYSAVCEAEEAISTLERHGIVEGVKYEAACGTLRQRFETARKLALQARVRVWVQ